MKLYHKKYEYDYCINLHAKTMYAWIQDKKGSRQKRKHHFAESYLMTNWI
ncbi:MAG: hypothetical protein MRK02_08220 [Candidatus Scalindua sp.]|nr:hypothetical protein [Candidatus Scalindua sp.]